MDFVTGLPTLDGNTCIKTYNGHVHFVLPPKLPTAKEIAMPMILHVFRLLGLLGDIVSDQGALSALPIFEAIQ